jgi:hypothetical protein
MPISQLVVFGCWLAAALVGGALLWWVWQRIWERGQRKPDTL